MLLELESVTPKDIDKTGGLPEKLIIFEGARVVLGRNIDVKKGLMNGATGLIIKVIWPVYRKDQMYNIIHPVELKFILKKTLAPI